MDKLSSIFSFILYEDVPNYDVQDVLVGLESDLSQFYKVKHCFSANGYPCKPHFHVLGYFPHPVPRSYFVERYHIPLYCIDFPLQYSSYRQYMDDGCYEAF